MRLADDRTRLFVRGGLRRDRLVGDFDLFEKESELGIAIDRPPFAAIERVARRRDFPAFKLLVVRRGGSCLGQIIGPNGTTGHRERYD